MRLGLYKHYKGGLYEVLSEALHTETQEIMIYYRRQKSPASQEFFVRPKSMFLGNVEVCGKKVPRFDWLGINN